MNSETPGPVVHDSLRSRCLRVARIIGQNLGTPLLWLLIGLATSLVPSLPTEVRIFTHIVLPALTIGATCSRSWFPAVLGYSCGAFMVAYWRSGRTFDAWAPVSAAGVLWMVPISSLVALVGAWLRRTVYELRHASWRTVPALYDGPFMGGAWFVLYLFSGMGFLLISLVPSLPELFSVILLCLFVVGGAVAATQRTDRTTPALCGFFLALLPYEIVDFQNKGIAASDFAHRFCLMSLAFAGIFLLGARAIRVLNWPCRPRGQTAPPAYLQSWFWSQVLDWRNVLIALLFGVAIVIGLPILERNFAHPPGVLVCALAGLCMGFFSPLRRLWAALGFVCALEIMATTRGPRLPASRIVIEFLYYVPMAVGLQVLFSLVGDRIRRVFQRLWNGGLTATISTHSGYWFAVYLIVGRAIGLLHVSLRSEQSRIDLETWVTGALVLLVGSLAVRKPIDHTTASLFGLLAGCVPVLAPTWTWHQDVPLARWAGFFVYCYSGATLFLIASLVTLYGNLLFTRTFRRSKARVA